MKVSKFHEAFTTLLKDRLTYFNDKKLDLVICVEIYQVIFNTLVDVISPSPANLTNEAMNYLAQQYYDGIMINGTQELNPNIFTARAKLENIETKELALLAVMLNGTEFTIPLVQEIKRRS